MTNLCSEVRAADDASVDKQIECNMIDISETNQSSMNPFLLEIEPTNVCNLRCDVCCWSNPEFSRGNPRHMSFELLRRIIDTYDYKFRTIQFCGTCEPTMNPNLPDMIRYAASRAGRATIELITNGTLLTPKLGSAIVNAGLTRLKVSLDGPDEDTYHSIRHSNLMSVLKNLEIFVASTDVDVSINCVVTSINLERLQDFPRLAASLGVHSLEFRLFEGGAISGDHLGTRIKQLAHRWEEVLLGNSIEVSDRRRQCACSF